MIIARSTKLGWILLRRSIRKALAATAVAIAPVVAAGSCADPTSSPTMPGGGTDSTVVRLKLTAPESILVNGSYLLNFKALTASGNESTNPNPTFATSDPSVVTVGQDGLFRARALGVATITAMRGGLSAKVTVRVGVRVIVQPQYWWQPRRSTYTLATGDSIRFVAWYADVDGLPLAEQPEVQWTSDNPSKVDVTPEGIVIGVQSTPPPCPCDSGTITAITAQGNASAGVTVSSQTVGQPAHLRLAHTATGLGPVRFLRNNAEPVTLQFGESAEVEIRSGTLILQTEGLPEGAYPSANLRNFAGLINPGDRIAAYAVGDASQSFLVHTFTPPMVVPPDSAVVRLVQTGWGPPIVYLRGPGAAISGLPELCYFDPTDTSPFYRRAAGAFDIIGVGKYSNTGMETGRISAIAEPGRVMTYVLVASVDTPLRAFVFYDQ